MGLGMIAYSIGMSWWGIRSQNKELAKLESGEDVESGDGVALVMMGISFVQFNVAALDLGFQLPSPFTDIIQAERSALNAGTSFPAFSCAIILAG